MNKNTLYKLQLTTILYNKANEITDLGLMNGKMGLSIFFSHLAQETNNEEYQNFAEELLEEICGAINLASFDFESGIPGIGWGLEYLLQNNLIKVDAEDVFKEFDVMVLEYLLLDINLKTNTLDKLIGYGVYFLKRIQNKKYASNNEDVVKNKQNLICIIDELDKSTKNTFELVNEPLSWNLRWSLPILIWFLSELYLLDVFSVKVEKILKRITEEINTRTDYPKLHCNRLFLKWSVSKLSQDCTNLITLKNTLDEVVNYIDREKIKIELPQNDFTFQMGTSGIAWIYIELYKIKDIDIYKEEANYWSTVTSKIADTSEFIDFIETKKKPYGLLTGLAGVGFITLIDRGITKLQPK